MHCAGALELGLLEFLDDFSSVLDVALLLLPNDLLGLLLRFVASLAACRWVDGLKNLGLKSHLKYLKLPKILHLKTS